MDEKTSLQVNLVLGVHSGAKGSVARSVNTFLDPWTAELAADGLVSGTKVSETSLAAAHLGGTTKFAGSCQHEPAEGDGRCTPVQYSWSSGWSTNSYHRLLLPSRGRSWGVHYPGPIPVLVFFSHRGGSAPLVSSMRAASRDFLPHPRGLSLYSLPILGEHYSY